MINICIHLMFTSWSEHSRPDQSIYICRNYYVFI